MRLTQEQKALMRERYAAGETAPDIAKDFDVRRETVNRICKGIRKLKVTSDPNPTSDRTSDPAKITSDPKEPEKITSDRTSDPKTVTSDRTSDPSAVPSSLPPGYKQPDKDASIMHDLAEGIMRLLDDGETAETIFRDLIRPVHDAFLKRQQKLKAAVEKAAQPEDKVPAQVPVKDTGPAFDVRPGFSDANIMELLHKAGLGETGDPE